MAGRDLSFWHDSLPEGDTLAPRPSLPGDTETDVAIVGGGFTGLWTALYLRRLDPTMRVTVVEAEFAGFGASGRNGGWCSALLPMSLDAMAKRAGRDEAVAMQRAMFATVDEVGRAAEDEGIDCHFAKGGYLHLATNPAHTTRLHAELTEARRFDLGEEELRWLDRAEAAERVRAEGLLGALYTPHCAAIHPARLARGLATAVERRGGVIHEGTRAKVIEPGRVVTDHGVLRADVVVRATEGFTATLQGREADARAPLLADDRHGAPARGGVGRHRPPPAGDVQRRPPPHHLRAAHGGRAAGLRWPRRPLPLRFRGPTELRP